VETTVTAKTKTEGVRARLRAAAEAEGDRLEAFLSDALDAEREVTARCQKCQRSTAVVVPDWSARLKATQMLLTEGYGPQKAATEDERMGVTLIVKRPLMSGGGPPWDELSEEDAATVRAAQAILDAHPTVFRGHQREHAEESE
jgi:hypothetical protein